MPKNKNKLVTLIVGLVLLCLVLAGGFLTWAGRPVTSEPQIKSVQGASTEVHTTQLMNSIFRSTIQSNMVVKSDNQSSHGDKVLQLLLATSDSNITSTNSDQIGITIGISSNRILNELSDIQYRLHKPDIYQLSQFNNSPAGSMHFFKVADGYETSLFWLHKDSYVAVVASGSVERAAQLDSQLRQLVDDWVWNEQ